MSRLDEFTLNMLCNPEVIDVNRDALGQCAREETDKGAVRSMRRFLAEAGVTP